MTALLVPEVAPAQGLSAAGLTIMVVSIGSTLTLVIWTYSRILRGTGRTREEDDGA